MILALAALIALSCLLPQAARTQVITHVIHISVDGLRPDAVTALGPALCPNFHLLMVEGTFTLNARTDCDYTSTLPDHACQMTGRAVLGSEGHGVSFNSDGGSTIADAHGSYVAGVFDAAHDNGLVTALFAGKDKFALFDRSWDAVNGAPDITGEDDGRDKIDRYMYLWDTSALVDSCLALLDSGAPGYTLLHLRDPDTDGHAYGWMSAEYLEAVMRMDAYIGMVLEAVEGDPALDGSTAVIVTADHGGTGTDHSDPSIQSNYTVQFHAWGPGIPAGADIYWLNPDDRLDPGSGRPPCDAAVPPVRNGETANAACSLLGLPPVPGSTIGAAPDLTVTCPGTLPLVTIISPSDGTEFCPGDIVLIEVDASSAGGISRVEFFLDQALIGEDTEAPWSFAIDGLPLGEHVLTARAVDAESFARTDRITLAVSGTTDAELADRQWDAGAIVSPNPVDGSSRVYLDLARPGPVELTVYDAAGRLLRRSVSRSLPEGQHALELDAGGFPAGVYFFRASTAGGTGYGKFILIR